MSINFSSYEIGRRALNANQLGIDITGQNIANVNTAGYTRREVQLTEAGSQDVNGTYLTAGVDVAGVQSARDNFIQSRIQTETGASGRLTAERDTLASLETALQGSDTGGLTPALNNFFGSFRDLEASPNSTALRSVVVQRGAALATAFQTTSSRLTGIQKDADTQLRQGVDQINDLASKVATLNDQIRKINSAAGDASTLTDQRTELVNQLAEAAGARATNNTDGTVTLTIGGGQAIVAGDKAFTLQAVSTPPSGLASITLNGQPAVFADGTVAGLQNAISDIGSQISDLDSLAGSVVSRVNSLHTSGTDLDGNAGVNFFDASTPVTAANISVSAAVAANSRLVVASPLTTPGATGTIAGQIADLLTDTNSTAGTRTGSFSSIFSSMIADAGAKAGDADNNLQTQAAILSQATAQRDSVSGVSLDEEAINLLQYQKAFDAASKFIKVADEMTQMVISLAGD